MLRYGLASQFWRAIPAQWADEAWQRRGQRLLARAVRSVPAYRRLRHVFATAKQDPIAAAHHYPRTSWSSYVDVFPMEQRGRFRWQRQVVSFDPLGPERAPTDSWPRSTDELRTLREQLAGLLSMWFDTRHRRVLLLVNLPGVGWSGSRRITQALQEAIVLGQLHGTVMDLSADPGEVQQTISRHAGQFEQCVVFCPAKEALRWARQLSERSSPLGLIALGAVPPADRAAMPVEFPFCSIWGADEIGPLIGTETPLTRLVAQACQADARMKKAILPGEQTVIGLYQPFPLGPWIEQDAGDLLISNWGVSPTFRYSVNQRGHVTCFGDIYKTLLRYDVCPPGQIRRLTRMGSACWKLPLLALSVT